MLNTYYNIRPDEIKTNNQSRTLSINITDETNVITIIGNKDEKTIDEDSIDEDLFVSSTSQVCSTWPCDDEDSDRDNKFSKGGVNRMKICENTPSFIVSEPCDELVDSDNELTSKGKEVVCSLGRPLAGLVGSSIGDPTGLAGGFVADKLLDCPRSSSSGIGNGIVDDLLSKLLN